MAFLLLLTDLSAVGNGNCSELYVLDQLVNDHYQSYHIITYLHKIMIMTFFALSPQKQLSLSLPLFFHNFVPNLEPEFFQIKITEKMYLKGKKL